MKAIETAYKGYRFRSRLEARWAVFFNHMRVKWLYEPEGFETPAGRYLPDFYLPRFGMWVEIKPGEPNETELQKAIELLCGTRKPVFISSGLPDEVGTAVYSYTQTGGEFNIIHGKAWLVLDAVRPSVALLPVGSRAPKFALEPHDHEDALDIFHWAPGLVPGAPYFNRAAVARSARFEFGEAGA